MIFLLFAFACQDAGVQMDSDQLGNAITVPARVRYLAALDLNQNGVQDLVAFSENSFYLPGFPEVAALPIPGQATLWTVADLKGNGQTSLLILEDGKSLRELTFHDQVLQFSAPLQQHLGGTSPLGIYPADFLIDLDGDGYLDLLVPWGEKVLVWHGAKEGFRRGPALNGLATLELRTEELGKGGMLDEYKRSYSIPFPKTQDVNGDGRLDLLLRSGGTVMQFLATEEGLPDQPSASVEFDQFRPKFESSELDFSNLTRLLKYIVVDEWADLDNDGALDLMVLGDGKVRVFMGGPQGIDLKRKMRPLKLAGNPFYLKAAHIDEDEHLDLVLMSVQDIGIGTVISAAIGGLKINFDFFVFRGKGNGKFESRLYKQIKVVLESGRIQDEIKQGKDEFQKQRDAVVRLADFDGDGQRTDLALLGANGQVDVWWKIAENREDVDTIASGFLKRAFEDEGKLKVDLNTLTSWAMGRTSALVSLAEGKKPDWSFQLPSGWVKPHTMIARNLSGGPGEELLVLRKTIALLQRRPHWTLPLQCLLWKLGIKLKEQGKPEAVISGWILQPQKP